MSAGLLRNATTGQVLASNVRYATTWWDRFAGFIPKAVVDPDEGLWFPHCWAIHTVGMRAHIDVIFLDKDGRVIRSVPRAPRHRPAIAAVGAASVVELGAGALDGRDVLPGDRLTLE